MKTKGKGTMWALGGTAAVVGALMTIWGGVEAIRPVLNSESPGWASLEHVNNLSYGTQKTFNSVQGQSLSDRLRTASTFCPLFRNLAAQAEANALRHRFDRQALNDKQLYEGLRDAWCAILANGGK